MLYLESFLHRVTFAEIVSRWIVNQPSAGDVFNLKKIVNFNSYISRIWVDRLFRDIVVGLRGSQPESRSMQHKADLKDVVTAHPHFRNDRIDEMISHYLRFPEDFYRETPVDGRLYYEGRLDDPYFLGSTRIKRYKRIAEKGSRRIVEFMFDRIKQNAEDLADERARSLGVSRAELLTPFTQMVEEFEHAERRLIKTIKQGTIHSEFPILSIPDVVGIKLIVERDERASLLELVKNKPDCKLLETEEHTGLYNALNLRLAYHIPKSRLLECPPAGPYLEVLGYRGFDIGEVKREYEEFIRTSEDHVIVEIIVSGFEDFLESEIGLAMHEERLIKQRAKTEYNGHLSTNVRYLMNYIFSMCRAPGPESLESVPVKLWVRYVPDTIEEFIRELYVSNGYYFDNMEDEPVIP